MKGAKLSKSALLVLYDIRKARTFCAFAKSVRVDKQTLLEMAKGGYVGIDIVRKVEAGLKQYQTTIATPAQVIIIKVAEKKGVTPESVIAAKSLNRYGNYSAAEMAKYIATHIIYKETRLSLREIAAEVGCKHTSVTATLERIGGLMDVNRELRTEIFSIQRALSRG